MTWQLQEAKQRFSEVVRRALEQGPQVVTRHGEAAVVIVSAREFEALKGGGWRLQGRFSGGRRTSDG